MLSPKCGSDSVFKESIYNFFGNPTQEKGNLRRTIMQVKGFCSNSEYLLTSKPGDSVSSYPPLPTSLLQAGYLPSVRNSRAGRPQIPITSFFQLEIGKRTEQTCEKRSLSCL